MIVSFGDKLTKKIWDDESPIKGFSADFVKKAYKKLYYINLASDVEVLRFPPSNYLEKLQGNLKDFWSIRIDRKYRIIFKFDSGNAYDDEISKHYQ